MFEVGIWKSKMIARSKMFYPNGYHGLIRFQDFIFAFGGHTNEI